MGTAVKHPVSDRVMQSFVIFDIMALWRSALSIRVPWCQNFKWLLNPIWHRMLYSCTHMATVGVKGLSDMFAWFYKTLPLFLLTDMSGTWALSLWLIGAVLLAMCWQVVRLENQVKRFKIATESLERSEEELKTEKRKYQKDVSFRADCKNAAQTFVYSCWLIFVATAINPLLSLFCLLLAFLSFCSTFKYVFAFVCTYVWFDCVWGRLSFVPSATPFSFHFFVLFYLLLQFGRNKTCPVCVAATRGCRWERRSQSAEQSAAETTW